MKTLRLFLTASGGAALLFGAGCASDRTYSDQAMVTPPAPPPLETPPATPGRDYSWNAHSWAFQPDRWTTRPAGAAVWVPGHWIETSQGRVWRPGRWE